MGKWLLCAEHPSNEFFRDFQNTLIYTSSPDFSEKLNFAEVRPACQHVLSMHHPVSSMHPVSGLHRSKLTASGHTLYKIDRPCV